MVGAYTTEFIKMNIENFKSFFEKIKSQNLAIKELAPYIYEITPVKKSSVDKVMGLMALIMAMKWVDFLFYWSFFHFWKKDSLIYREKLLLV